MKYKILANEDAIKKILSKGVKNMPQNPAACGYKPEQIRKFYYETEELTLELMKAIEENIYKIIVNYAAIVEVDTLPEASNETIGKVYVLKGEIISKEKDLYKYAYTTIMQEDKYVWLKVSDNVLATLLSEGEGKYSIVTKEDNDRANQANGRANFSGGHRTETYQKDTFGFGAGVVSGMKKAETSTAYRPSTSGSGENLPMTVQSFNDFYWDSVNNVPKNGGLGKDANGNVLDRDGNTYENSYGLCITTGNSTINTGKASRVDGENNVNEAPFSNISGRYNWNKEKGENSNLHGYYNTNNGKFNTLIGQYCTSYNEIEEYKGDFNYCTLLGYGLKPSNDSCTIVGKGGGNKQREFAKNLLFGVATPLGHQALEVYDDDVVRVIKPPVYDTDVARLKEINELDKKLNTKIDTLHANGFVVSQTLPTASKDTVGKIYLILQEQGRENDIYDEYITVSYNDTFSWEKIGSTEFKMIVDTELSLDSTNPVQNKVITEALDGKLDKDTVGNGTVRVYAITANGEQTTGYALATSAAACVQPRIPLYYRKDNTQGDIEPPHSLLTGTPKKPYHATNKKYVDDLVASSGVFKYVHNIVYARSGEPDEYGLPTSILEKFSGLSKTNTPFTYVQGKGICLGTFNFEEHLNIVELGIQPELFVLTSAYLNNLTEICLSPTTKGIKETSNDGVTFYLTKLNDIDLSDITFYGDNIVEA